MRKAEQWSSYTEALPWLVNVKEGQYGIYIEVGVSKRKLSTREAGVENITAGLKHQSHYMPWK